MSEDSKEKDLRLELKEECGIEGFSLSPGTSVEDLHKICKDKGFSEVRESIYKPRLSSADKRKESYDHAMNVAELRRNNRKFF